MSQTASTRGSSTGPWMWAALMVWSLVVLGCERPRTQIIVRIEATPATWAQMRSIRVTARREGRTPIVADRCLDVREGRDEFGIVPRDPDDPSLVEITVKAYTTSCPDAGTAPHEMEMLSQRTELAFVKETTLLVLMPFTLQCQRADVCARPPRCTRGTTCRAIDEQGTPMCVCVEDPIVRQYNAAGGGGDANGIDVGVGDAKADTAVEAIVGDLPNERVEDTLDAREDLPNERVEDTLDAREDLGPEHVDPAPDAPADIGIIAPLRCDVPGERTGLPRNCEEVRCADPDAGSDVYLIDPLGNAGRCADAGVDGDVDASSGVQVCPFRAYCDMSRDEGGWTLLGVGIWPVGTLRPEILGFTGNALLSYDRIRALKFSLEAAGQPWLFRLGEGAQRLYILDQGASPETMHEEGFAVWATFAPGVTCGLSYSQVTDNHMTRALRSSTCGSLGSGFATVSGLGMCGRGAWSLTYHDGLRMIYYTYNGDGEHPCAFYDLARETNNSDVLLHSLWIRSGRNAVTGSASTCTGTSCPCGPSPQMRCDGSCVDVSRDHRHCGRCGNACPSGQSCRDARCVTPATTWVQRSCNEVPTEVGCGVVEVAPSLSFTLGVEARQQCNRDGGNPTCAWNAAPPIFSDRFINGFVVDAYEVTVSRFRRFWMARGAADAGAGLRSSPVAYPGRAISWPTGARFDAAVPITSATDPRCNWSDSPSAREAHPINCIDWWTAQEFCVWDGGGRADSPQTGRLPTEKEWEYIARVRNGSGTVETRLYPWGEPHPTVSCDRARWNATSCYGQDDAQTRRVGSFSPTVGFFDLAGNVAEWVADQFYVDRESCVGGPSGSVCNYAAPRSNVVVRGGSWRDTDPAWLRGASRAIASPEVRLSTIGFRCARTAP